MHSIIHSYDLSGCSRCSKSFYLMRSLLQRKLGLVALHVWSLRPKLALIFSIKSQFNL